MWRPYIVEWNKAYKPKEVYAKATKDIDRELFEAGADAMIEALILRGKHTDGIAPTLSINVLPEQGGYLVFIPDKGE